MLIKYLVGDGVPRARIARRLGVSRQTVYNHLNREEPFPKPRAKRGSMLDLFKGYIRGRLQEFDLPCTVLLEELKGRGYRGGLTILREFVRPLKQEFTRRVVERFETQPGRQAQVDWGECGTITVDGERRKLYVFVMVLGYSRMLYARFTTSSRLPVLLSCLRSAFEALGIARELLVDNMKQAVDQHDVETGTVHWNATFLDFAEHHGFMPAACPPYWPRAKGKVERGVGYIKASFLEGRAFADLDDLNQQCRVWLDTVANVRVHGTTGQRPIDRYAEELPKLRALAAVPVYDTRPLIFRRVSSDSHMSYGGVPYSVHPVAARKTVTVRPEGDRVGQRMHVYFADRLVAEHRIQPSGTRRVTLPEHQKAIRELSRKHVPARRPRKAPRFVQLPLRTPEVEIRPLSAYDRYAEEVAG